MKDDNFTELFEKFNPELSPDCLFMAKLQRGMEAMEIVKRHSHAVARRNKIAVVLASFSGFVAGVLLMLLFPVLESWMSIPAITIPYIPFDAVHFDPQHVLWIITALTSGIIACNVYTLAVSRPITE